jgi:hypothetical protein
MKNILKPAVEEVAQYTCDVTGLPLPNGPAATITINGGYGSPMDGATCRLDLSEKASMVVIPLLRALLIDGGALMPYLTNSMLMWEEAKERRITRREQAKLLKRLEKLRCYRRRVLTTVKKGLKESADRTRR